MKSPDINFASGLGKRHRVRVPVRTLTLGILGLVLTGALSLEVISVELKQRSLGTEMESMKERLHAARARKPAGAGEPARDEIVGINKAIRQLNLPWRPIFDAVEQATPAAIAVLSLAPDANRETLTIVAESQTTDSMLHYVRQLRAQPLFDDVAIASHEINEKDPHKPVRFEVAAHWKLNR